jgi:hypothetical protein
MALAPVSMFYRTMFVQAHIALNNAMACRAFRGIRLGLIQDVNSGSIPSATNLIILRSEKGFGKQISRDCEWIRRLPCYYRDYEEHGIWTLDLLWKRSGMTMYRESRQMEFDK